MLTLVRLVGGCDGSSDGCAVTGYGGEALHDWKQLTGLKSLSEDGDLSYYCRDTLLTHLAFFEPGEKTLSDRKQKSGSVFAQSIFKLICGK